ncbi:MAG: hypothetical protein IPP57_23675 [Candidatus Obscuribacter sp.]|nr:hypothetical protein [Candidatus Obscuribacter sp.]
MGQLATRFYQSLLLMTLLLGAAGPTVARENPKDFTLPSTLDYSKAPSVKSFSDLSPSALHVASLLNIDNDLRDLDSQAKSADRDRLNLLILKQNLTEAILSLRALKSAPQLAKSTPKLLTQTICKHFWKNAATKPCGSTL